MTIEQIRAAANEAGWRYMRESGEVPEGTKRWTRGALFAAMSEMNRLARLHGIDLYQLPRSV